MSGSFEKSVKGGTKVKLAAPKSKYVEHILVATHAGEAGVGEIFRALQPRLRDASWTIVFKSLIIVHYMVREGEQDVTLKFISRNPSKLSANNYSDAQAQGRNIRHYNRYLMERARAYKDTKIDYVREGEGRLKRLSIDKGVLRETEVVQAQIETLLKCNLLTEDVENEISLTAFRLLVTDLLALFYVMNEGVINILEHYFEISKVDAEKALAIYRVFSKQTTSVVEFLAVARNHETSTRLEVPKLKHAPTSLTKMLEEYLNDPDFEVNRRQYLAEQDAKKGTKSSSRPAPSQENPRDLAKKLAKPQKQAQAQQSQAQPQQQAQAQNSNAANASGPGPQLMDFFAPIDAQPTYARPDFGDQFRSQSLQTGMPQGQMQQQPQQQISLPFAPQQGFNFGQPGQMQQQSMPGQMNQQMNQQMMTGQMPQMTGQLMGQMPGQAQLPQMTGQFGQMQLSSQPQTPQSANPMNPMMTGLSVQTTNPFRQSILPMQQFTESPTRQNTNPFARSTFAPQMAPIQQSMPLQQQQQQPLQQMQPMHTMQPMQPAPTGTNPFARQMPTPTGSTISSTSANADTNPFRSMSVRQRPNQGTIGGMEPMSNVSVFPQTQNQWSGNN